MRECTKCEYLLPEEEFYILGNGKRRSVCISCVSEYNKRYHSGERIGRDRKVDEFGNLECYRCKVWQKPDNFNVRGNSGWVDSHCKPCRREYQKEWAIEKKYSINLRDLNQMLLEQSFECKICKRDIFIDSDHLAVDHDHDTGGIRGILCQPCNMALGLFKDDEEILASAIEYLRDALCR